MSRKIQDTTEAIEHALALTNNRPTENSLKAEIGRLEELIKSSSDNTRYYLEKDRNEKQEALLRIQQEGNNFPQGIDELIIELIELMATLHGLSCSNAKETESAFISQWKLGALYSSVSIIGKLASTHEKNDENSLTNLWKSVSDHILNDGIIHKKEYEKINEMVSGKGEFYPNPTSPTRLLRNKTISHNEKIIDIDTDEIDREIKILVRIWSIIINWCSLGVFSPFRDSKTALKPLEKLYDQSDFEEIVSAREDYLEKTKEHSKTQLHNNTITDNKGGIRDAPSVRVEIKMQQSSHE